MWLTINAGLEPGTNADLITTQSVSLPTELLRITVNSYQTTSIKF